MVKQISILSVLALLAACGTPQEQCIARETRDLRVVDKLIIETKGNLARGYAFEDITISRTVWVRCEPIVLQPASADAPAPAPAAPRLCLDDQEETISRPKAIDLTAERSKLSGLTSKRKELIAAANRSIAACKKAYPE